MPNTSFRQSLESVRRLPLRTLLLGLVAFLLLLFVGSVAFFYAAPRSASPMIDGIADQLPYPIAIVGYQSFITEPELAGNIASVKRFYENQDFSELGLRVDFSTEEGQKRLKVRERDVLNKMIEDEAVMQLGHEYGIRITEQQAREGVRRTLEEYGSAEQVIGDLDRLYGWSLRDFEEKIVLPSLYQEELEALYMKERGERNPAGERIQDAQEALKAGGDFSEIAKAQSEGQTAAQGGELGWFRLEDLAEPLRDPVRTQKIGEPGSIIESPLGYHIVKVEESRNEGGEVLYRLSQIFTRKETFADWLKERMQSMSIHVLSPEYRWDKNAGEAVFRSEPMRAFESELYESQDGDALFLF